MESHRGLTHAHGPTVQAVLALAAALDAAGAAYHIPAVQETRGRGGGGGSRAAALGFLLAAEGGAEGGGPAARAAEDAASLTSVAALEGVAF